MNDELQIGRDAERLLKAYPGLLRGFIAVIDEINEIGSIKQAREEANRRLAAVRDELTEIETGIARQRHDADIYVADKQAAGDKLLVDAKSQAADLIKAADEAAEVTARQAAEAAVRVEEEARRKAAIDEDAGRIARQDLAETMSDLARTQQELAIVRAEIVEATATRDQIQAEIAALRARLQG